MKREWKVPDFFLGKHKQRGNTKRKQLQNGNKCFLNGNESGNGMTFLADNRRNGIFLFPINMFFCLVIVCLSRLCVA
jgi:hypothetical protein